MGLEEHSLSEGQTGYGFPPGATEAQDPRSGFGGPVMG